MVSLLLRVDYFLVALILELVKMSKSSITEIGSGNLDRLSRKIAGRYEVLVGLPNSGQRYAYRSYEYGPQKKKGEKKQSPKAPISISASTKPYPLVSEVGFWAEFGTKTEPERSFLRKTVMKNLKRYLQINRQIAIKVLRGDLELLTGLKKFSLLVQNDVKTTIHEYDTPPNAKSTIARKGTNAPLKYKGTLVQAIRGLVRFKT